jgi:hypothetical protein
MRKLATIVTDAAIFAGRLMEPFFCQAAIGGPSL